MKPALSRLLVATLHGDGFVGGAFLSSPFGGRATVVAETAGQPAIQRLVYGTTLVRGPASCLSKDLFFSK